jgi:ABC-type transporter Mla MlaB component
MSSNRGRFHLASIQQAHGVLIRACGQFIVGHGAAETLWTPHVELANRGTVMLDLAGVTDIDARGLGVLAWLVRRSAERSVAPSVVAASQVVATLAGLTRLDRVLRGAWNNRFGAAPDCFARLKTKSRAAVDRRILRSRGCINGAQSTCTPRPRSERSNVATAAPDGTRLPLTVTSRAAAPPT